MIPKNNADFRQSLSLSGICKHLASIIETEIKKRCNRYCLFYHLRHVLDTNSTSVAVLSTDQELALDLWQRNEKLGFHTFNHVLDSLYYPERTGQSSIHGDVGICVRVNYSMNEHESCHLFDDLQFIRASPDVNTSKSTIQFPSGIADTRHAYMGVRWEDDLVNIQDHHADFDVPELLFGDDGDRDESGTTRLYEQYLCGTQKLCSKLGIGPSIVTYRSIMAAVYQLGMYANPSSRFGAEVVTILLRPRDHFGFAVGLTAITDTFLSNSVLQEIAAILFEHFEAIQLGDLPSLSTQDAHCLDALLHFNGLRYTRSRQSDIPQAICRSIANKILELNTSQGKQIPTNSALAFRSAQNETPIEQTVRSLVGIALNFCEEKLEGRALQFGILLGHAFLMRYWPGVKPLPATQSSRILGHQEFFPLLDLPKQVHLLESPEERCLIVPYCNFSIDDWESLPAYILKLSDFTEALSAWRAGSLWSSELRPYAYLTARYPWAVAAVVGPASEIRIFVGGQLHAYRDGKGWRTYEDPIADIMSSASDWRPEAWSQADRAGHESLLRAMLALAIQMSPIARRASHGGLLVYAPLAADSEDWRAQSTHMQRLHDAEPERAGGSGRWLTGRSLLRRRTDNTQSILDVSVAQLILRAAKLDGAVVLCNPDGYVKYFGRRLSYMAEDVMARGTKRLAAQSFVSEFARRGLTWAVAIAVSSDGPISIYTCSRTKPYYRETLVLGRII